MASGEEPTEQLRYQTWVLKVSIHCEGCKRKVRRVLQNIEVFFLAGVYTTFVDLQQHKVTVTGNVEAETPIRKLLRNGKQAELWPEKPQSKKDKAKDNNDKNSDDGNGNGKKPNKSNGQQQQPTEPKIGGEVKCSSDDSGAGATAGDKASNGGGGSADGGKKKGKKGQKKENAGVGGDATATDEPSSAKGGSSPPPLPPAQHQLQQGLQFPAYLPPPVYAVSYNTAHPTTSYGYYAAPPPEALLSESYLYSIHHPSGAFYYPPPPYVVLSPPHGGSYDAFSEENANSCSVM